MKRQITEAEKPRLLQQHRQQDGFIHCFVDNEKIENESEIHFDHIEPYAKVQETSIGNIAPVCKKHNLAKKDMPLSEYRDKLQMVEFFDRFDSEKKKVKLNDVLAFKHMNNYGFPVQYDFDSEHGKIALKYFQDKDKIRPPICESYSVFKCPVTDMSYFYGMIPVRNILNDGKEQGEIELQPRALIFEHLWDLYRHLRVNTQLQPTICRLQRDESSLILVFDGQHKAAARIWAGVSSIEAKVYIEPNVVWLMKTNLIAHDNLIQLKFYSSILAEKMAELYDVNWQRYIETPGKKSEKGFCTFIKYSEGKSEEKPDKEIEAFLITSVLSNKENEFSKYVAPRNKTGKQYAISWDSMHKYYFRYFLNRPPLQIEIDSKDDFRNQEIHNNIRLLNILAKEILTDKWNPSEANEAHKKAERIFRPGAIMVWFPMLRQVIYNKLNLVNTDEAKEILFRNISDEKWGIIEQYIKIMMNHKIWVERDPNIDIVLGNKKSEITQQLFSDKKFTAMGILGMDNM